MKCNILDVVLAFYSQKMIIIGKKGSMIKEIGELARKDMSDMMGRKVHLFLLAKVKEDWMSSISQINSDEIK